MNSFLSVEYLIIFYMEEMKINALTKEGKYKEIIPQIESLVCGEEYVIAKMANISAVLKEVFDFWWVGFYLTQDFALGTAAVTQENSQLILGPFQGPIACQRIRYGRGVCGTSWKEARTIIVPDVDKFPGHIACSSLSRSEIVVPIYKGDVIVGVLDIDSREADSFDDVDSKFLNDIVRLLF